jgi:phosphonate transport system substrate-binding protein
MEITKQMFQVEGDANLSAEDKAAQLKELEAQKAEYEALMAKVPQA